MLFICWALKSATLIQMVCCVIIDIRLLLSKLLHCKCQICGIAGVYLSFGAAAIAYISCEAAERLKLADSAKLFALTFLLVTFGAHDRTSML